LAQGRVWTGAQAKQNGLVDEIGGIDRAIELVKQRAKIGASDKIKLVAYPSRRTLLQVLMDREQLAEMESQILATRIDSRLDSLIGDPSTRSLIHALLFEMPHGGVMSRMPYSVSVR
jgi:ClpP class serine protease